MYTVPAIPAMTWTAQVWGHWCVILIVAICTVLTVPPVAGAEEPGKLQQVQELLEKWDSADAEEVQALVDQFQGLSLDEGLDQMWSWIESHTGSDDNNFSALLLLGKATEQHPENVILRYGYGRILLEYKLYSASLEVLLPIAEQAPEFPSAHLNFAIGQNYVWLDQPVEIITYFTKVLPDIDRLQPHTQFKVYNGLGNSYGDIDEPAKAIDAFEQAITIDPSHPFPYHNMGLVYQNLHDWDKALELGQKALTIESFPAAHKAVGDVYANKKMRLDAIRHYELAIEGYPEYVSAWVSLGNQRVHLSEWVRAEEAYRSALAVNPEARRALAGLGWIRNKRWDYTGAIEYLDSALRSDPDYGFALRQIQLARYGADHPMASDEELESFQSDRREAARIIQEDARPLLASGQLEAALPKIRLALEINPYNSLAYEHLGYAHYHMGGFSEAAEALRTSMRLHPYVARSARNFACTLNKLDRLDEALAVVRETSEKIPFNDEFKKLVEDIQQRRVDHFQFEP